MDLQHIDGDPAGVLGVGLWR